MTTILTVFGLTAVGAESDASARERANSITGPRGTSTVAGSGSCSGFACARSVTKTGPLRNSASLIGTGHGSDGGCSGGGSASDPAGRLVIWESAESR